MPLRYAGTVLVSFCFLLSNMSGQEFSGRIISGERYIDLATYSPPTFGPWRIEKPPERLYVGDNKVRIEVQGSNGLHTWILDFSNNTFQVLERRHRVYSEGPLHMPIGSGARDAIYARPASRRRSSRPPEAEVERTSMLAAGLDELYLFRPADADNACPDWYALVANRPGGKTCRKVSDAVVKGRTAVKYEATFVNGKKSTFWIDRRVRVAVKWKGPHGSGTIQGIKEGAQSPALFEIPVGYQKGDLALYADGDVP